MRRFLTNVADNSAASPQQTSTRNRFLATAPATQVLDKPSRRLRISGQIFQNSSPIFDNIYLSQLDNIFFTILIKTNDSIMPTIDKKLSTNRRRDARTFQGRDVRVLRRVFPRSATARSYSTFFAKRPAPRLDAFSSNAQRADYLTTQRKGILKRVLFDTPQI